MKSLTILFLYLYIMVCMFIDAIADSFHKYTKGFHVVAENEPLHESRM